MGLGGLKTAWQRQTKDFGHTQGDKYTSVIFDNRGIGESDKPLMRYSTSEMAKDTVELLDHLGWTCSRQLHVIGISMGGMISQELLSPRKARLCFVTPYDLRSSSRSSYTNKRSFVLNDFRQICKIRAKAPQALLIPSRIASLSLISTAPRLIRTIPFVENLRNRINLFMPKPLDTQIANVKRELYTAAWLAKPDETEYTVQPFPTNGDRFAAGEIAKRQDPEAFNRRGFIAQAVAAGWHHKSAAQLKELGDQVGRERIQIVHGTEDRMITFLHGEVLLRELGGTEAGVTKAFYEGQGHVIPIEERKEFRELVEGMVRKTEGWGKE
ncbi:hypothetical protein LTR16_000242 [Cryomyces antarcticus]|uniref:AB hydrolase-1 domain-containing protein n=1 Tax=Cryomyces antarcticus TaxID=329879 RepID=A0ABR0KUS2_9PEZI|nr:hypothetical protein LTR16_000242 [Cryomyces antarcticus]